MPEDNGPNFDRRFPRYEWTPPGWLQTLIIGTFIGLLISTQLVRWFG